MLRGSYHNGFAPRDGMPLYPSLWSGCVGAWAPCLGPSGLTLRDWSGFSRHATLTNMDAGTDWVISASGYTLDFDGTNDYCVTSRTMGISGDAEVAISFWIYPRSNAASVGLLGFGAWGTARSIFGAWRQTTGAITIEYAGGNSAANASALAPINQWSHVVIQKTPGVINSTSQIVVNGIAYTATGSTGTPSFLDRTMSIGRWADFDSNYPNVLLDDVRLYRRVLSSQETRILASRRGIAYDLAPFRMPYSEQVAGFQAAWALRQRLILGGGGGLG